MRPTQHPTNNSVLLPPAGATREECQPLAITRVLHVAGGITMNGVISYWQPSADDLRLLAEGRAIYLSCLGSTHPPVRVGVDGDGML